MLLRGERLHLTLGDQLIQRLLGGWRETLIDLQQELRFGLRKMWRDLLDTEHKKPDNKLLELNAGQL